MTDWNELRKLAQAAHDAAPGEWYEEHGGMLEYSLGVHDARYIAAMSPDVALALLDERDRAVREIEEFNAELDLLQARLLDATEAGD